MPMQRFPHPTVVELQRKRRPHGPCLTFRVTQLLTAATWVPKLVQAIAEPSLRITLTLREGELVQVSQRDAHNLVTSCPPATSQRRRRDVGPVLETGENPYR